MPRPALPNCREIQLLIPKSRRRQSGIFPTLRKHLSYGSVILEFLAAWNLLKYIVRKGEKYEEYRARHHDY
jgi:hypothetical protein